MTNILPPLVELYAAYNRRINSELLCEVFAGNSGGKRGTDCCDSVIRDFRVVVRFANDMLASVERVLRVLGIGAGDKVRRIDAFGVIT